MHFEVVMRLGDMGDKQPAPPSLGATAPDELLQMHLAINRRAMAEITPVNQLCSMPDEEMVDRSCHDLRAPLPPFFYFESEVESNAKYVEKMEEKREDKAAVESLLTMSTKEHRPRVC